MRTYDDDWVEKCARMAIFFRSSNDDQEAKGGKGKTGRRIELDKYKSYVEIAVSITISKLSIGEGLRPALILNLRPLPHLISPPDAQELAILECIDGDVESDVPSTADELKSADFGKLDAGLDRTRLCQGRLLPPADLFEEMSETKRRFFGRPDRQETRCVVVPDLDGPGPPRLESRPTLRH